MKLLGIDFKLGVNWQSINIRRTWVATYAKEAVVTWVIPCMRALPDLVALTSFSTELGEVNICLNACIYEVKGMGKKDMSSHPPKQEDGF